MDIEQLAKRVDWIDDQRRKENSSLIALEERLLSLEGQLSAANQQVNDLSSEVTHLQTVLAKVDHFDTAVTQQRVEFNRRIDEVERVRSDRERELEEVRNSQLAGINNHLSDFRKELEPIGGIQTNLQARVEEEARLSRAVETVRNEVREARREDEDAQRTLKLLEEGRRREEKRQNDIQAEMLAIRRRVDEHRGRLDLATDGLRKAENKITDLATVESERRETYNTFFDKQNLQQTERDRQWRDYSTRFETIEAQAMDLETHLQTLHTAQRDINRTQGSVEELIERVERRINEITEMQRLTEDRFRQEWVTFKADDQKRWTNYTLSHEEQSRESNRNLDRVIEQHNEIDDRLQEHDDIVQQIDEQTTKRLQTLLSVTRDWVADYEKVVGSIRK